METMGETERERERNCWLETSHNWYSFCTLHFFFIQKATIRLWIRYQNAATNLKTVTQMKGTQLFSVGKIIHTKKQTKHISMHFPKKKDKLIQFVNEHLWAQKLNKLISMVRTKKKFNNKTSHFYSFFLFFLKKIMSICSHSSVYTDTSRPNIRMHG